MDQLNSLDEWCGQRVVKFFVNESAVLANKFHVSQGRFFINGIPILTTQYVKDIGSFNLLKRGVSQIARANRTNGTIGKIFRTLRCELMRYKPNYRLQLE